MAKDTFYFSHDYNARNDEKILSLRMSHGWEGYGLYWALIEKLRESKDYTLSLDFNLIAFDLRTDNQKIKSIVTSFGLFSIDEEKGKFYSESLLNRMQIKESKSQKAREAAQVRWSKKPKENAEVMQTHSETNANGMQVKESKVKENYISKEFLNDWNTIRTEKLKKPSNVKRLVFNQKEQLKDILKHYEPTDIQNALKALFLQDNIKFSSMTTSPKHFLENFETYHQAYIDQDDKVYGKKEIA